ncbi:MAG: PilZ domain-containing protein [Alphaproteobacteria bacterium]|nr:PilZ domain-containing protein [Alphaproteobacteria bacterium]
MRYTEARSEARYPFRAGFIEIEDRPLPLDDLSANGLGFKSENPDAFAVGQEINGFLVLQQVEEQYEIPVKLTVRRVVDQHIGCSMVFLFPNHVDTITGFISKLEKSQPAG